MIDNLFPCDIGAFVTIQETVMRLRTIGLISALVLGLLAGREGLEETQREIVKGDAATMGRIDDKKSLLSGLHS